MTLGQVVVEWNAFAGTYHLALVVKLKRQVVSHAEMSCVVAYVVA